MSADPKAEQMAASMVAMKVVQSADTSAVSLVEKKVALKAEIKVA